jgi:threonine aldolase
MREAIARAEVGDDVFGDDPTVQRLEETVAGQLGMEAALFMPSGTMANQVAVRLHTEPGDEILLEGQSHIYWYEAGAISALSGVIPRCLHGRHGIFTAEDVEMALRPADVHFAPTKLLCVENTHNRGGGSIWSLHEVALVASMARQHQLRLHLDGARLWNAAIAAGVRERDYASHFDTVSVCFSKGLGAPVGSALCGSRDMIKRARRFRKQFGGGMRQSGILAAAALYALENHRDRLSEDHANARLLAKKLSDIPGIEVGSRRIETNMVFFKTTTMSAAEFMNGLQKEGVRVIAVGADMIRAVTHLDVSQQDILQVAEKIARFLQHSATPVR